MKEEDIQIMSSEISINNKDYIIYLGNLDDFSSSIARMVFKLYGTSLKYYVNDNFNCDVVDNTYSYFDDEDNLIGVIIGLYLCFDKEEDMMNCHEKLMSLIIMDKLSK